MAEKKSKLFENTFTILSLISTPFILFITTTTSVFLRNQVEFSYNLSIYIPFLILFTFTFLIGVLVYFLSKKFFVFKILLWIYFLIGFLFFVFISIKNASFFNDGDKRNAEYLFVVFLGILILITFLVRKINPKKAIYIFGLIGLTMIISDVFLFSTSFGKDKYIDKDKSEISETKNNDNINQSDKAKTMPNIYHLILDAFQSDFFVSNLDIELKNNMGGMIFFPENTTLFGRTSMSVASTFLGKQYDYNTPQVSYQKDAFNSETSLLYHLKDVGYTTYAYFSPSGHFYNHKMKLFDNITHHYDNVDISIDHKDDTFVQLWIYMFLPRFFGNVFSIDPKILFEIKNNNLSSKTTPIYHYESFLKYLEKEKNLPENNRYTFIHLNIPHLPYLLESDCSYDAYLNWSTREKQVDCSVKIIIDFISLLKKLNRFDNSLIIIHADHGNVEESNFSEENAWHRSRALLLIKPIGRTEKDALQISDSETMITDIFPTILKSIGINIPDYLEGIPLINPVPEIKERKRYFNFWDNDISSNQISKSMTRYIIENNKIKTDKTFELKNNKP